MQNKSCLTIETNSSFYSEYQDLSTTQIDQIPDQKLISDIHIASHRLSNSAGHCMENLIQQMQPHKTSIIKIQTFYRMYSCKAKFNIRKKWARYRKFVLQELVDSEFTYIKDLESVIKNIYEPLQGVLTETESKQLFRNLKQIYLLNKQFLVEISEKFNNFTQRSCFGKIFDKYVQFFKIYYEYTSNFSIEIVRNLRLQNNKFDKFLLDLEECDFFKGSNMESYLIKPVQRLPKYVLLLKDLIKHTWQTHPDFASLKESLSKFIEVNCKIDMLMDNVLKNQMLFEFQKLFFDQIGVSIVESTRKYIQSETLNVLVSKQQKSVIVYICNDMIILTQRNQNTVVKTHEKLFDYLQLNDKSYCKNKAETQYCKFVFTVSSQEQSITFLCSDSEQKRKLIQLFESLIENLRQKVSYEAVQLLEVQSIRVLAKGTELRKTLFHSYTVYVMLISSGSLNFTLSTRYSNLVKLEIELRKDFPEIQLPHLSKNKWANNKQTQLIEARKIIIENFIEALLNSPHVKQNPDKVLKFLELPQSFYEMVTSTPTKETTIQRESYRKTLKSSSFNCEDISLSEALRSVRGSNPLRQTMHRKTLKENNNQQTIKVKIDQLQIDFMDEFYIYLPISSELRVLDLIEMASEVIKLKSYEDFKLYFFDGQESRILDDDDCIPKFGNMKQSNDGLMGKIQQMFKTKGKSEVQIIMKKYLYLSPKQERKDYQNDFVRLTLLSYQAFDEIKNNKYRLTFSQYCIYSVYYLIIKYYGHFKNIFTKQSLPMNLVKQLLPDKIFKAQLESIWVQEIFLGIGVVKQEIDLLIKQHDSHLQGFRKSEQQYQFLTQLLFMESLCQNELYGLHIFNTDVSQQTKETLNKLYQIEIEPESFIGIRFDRLCIIQKMTAVISIPLKEIINPQAFPFVFQFILGKNELLIFKTTCGLEIQKLIELYLDLSFTNIQ